MKFFTQRVLPIPGIPEMSGLLLFYIKILSIIASKVHL